MTEEPGKSHTGVKRPGGVSSNWRAEALSEGGSAVQSLICVCLFGPHGWQPTRLLCPWDSPGKNTGVGCHALLQDVKPRHSENIMLNVNDS